MVPPKSRLGRTDFLHQALDVLAADGPRALTAARMARELNVTTGSFYWHFDSVAAFCDELKTFWRDTIVVGIIDEAKQQADDPGANEEQAQDRSNLLGAAWLGSQDMEDPEYRFKLIGMVTADPDDG